MKYKAVIFDLFVTLVYNSSPSESESILGQMAAVLSMPAEALVQMWTETWDERNRGILKSYQACIEHICRVLNSPAEQGQIERAASIRLEMLKRELNMVREDAITVLSSIKAKGIRPG